MGLLRFLFFILAGYFAYLFVKSIFRKAGNRRDGEHLGTSRSDNTRLEADPVCGVYIAREAAVRRQFSGREIFFCSEKCAGKYLANSDSKA